MRTARSSSSLPAVVSASVDAWISLVVSLETQPGVGLENPPGQTPQLPPGCGPGDLQGMLGYHLQSCRDTIPPLCTLPQTSFADINKTIRQASNKFLLARLESAYSWTWGANQSASSSGNCCGKFL